ncbi:MAG TPA: hypothetical protein VMR70_04220 [Flavisolibacter sp.]|nr:hypothetical protein [Flavisolibacter sp.]
MKKFLAVLAIAGTLVACDNSGSASGSGDTTNVDSPAVVTPAPTDVTPVDSPATGTTTPVDSPATTTTTPTTDSAR